MAELVIGGIFVLLGIRSLLRWMRTGFEAPAVRDQVLFALHAAGRVGLWFAFAGFFFGYALIDQVGPFVRWYLFVPLGLAGLQLMTGVLLARSPSPRRGDEGRVRSGARGNPSPMSRKQPPGPLEPEKHGETAEPGHPQPEAAEVESARLLENQARDELRKAGLTDGDIRRLADEYVALDRGEDLDGFIAWAKERTRL
ncbi:MAG TPA: hypothetical protein VGL18_11060 [Actinomycetota bacterium]